MPTVLAQLYKDKADQATSILGTLLQGPNSHHLNLVLVLFFLLPRQFYIFIYTYYVLEKPVYNLFWLRVTSLTLTVSHCREPVERGANMGRDYANQINASAHGPEERA